MNTESSFSELITDKKEKTKWRESIFIITINTNKSYNSRDQATLDRMPLIKTDFEDLLHNLFDRRNLIKLFNDLGPVGGNKTMLTENHVRDIVAKTQVEVNEEGRGFLHSHTVIKVVHDTRVQVNLQLVRAVVNKKMANALTYNGKSTRPCVMVKGKKTTYNIEEYVN